MRIVFKENLIVFLSLLVVFIIVNVIGTKSERTIFIDGDGSGHYAYLPSIIKYNTFDFTKVFEVEKSRRPPDYMGHYFHKFDDILINKYTVGTALLQLPFYLLAHVICLIFGIPPDGYNSVFQFCIAISTLFYLTLGITSLIKLLSKFGVNARIAWIIAISVLFGTNLFFYSFVEPSFSHAYSFAIISIFLLSAKKLFSSYSTKGIILTSFLYGIIVLIRPVNAIVIFMLPAIAVSYYNFKSVFIKRRFNKDMLWVTIAFLIAVSPQLLINYLQTGSIIIYGYKDEGFYFTDPHIINFLISYKKGWLLYSPFFWLLIPAIIYMIKSQKGFASLGFIGFMLFQIYLFSAWWNWYYGDSFGMRPMVDSYAFYLIPIAHFTNNICKKSIKITVYSFIVLTIMVNLLQSYQYAKGIIHPDSMTKEAYWYVFMETDSKKARTIACGDETFYGKLNKSPFLSSSNNIDYPPEGWTKSSTSSDYHNSVRLSLIQDDQNIYSSNFIYKIPDTLIGEKKIYVRFKSNYYEPQINSALGAVFVVDISNETENIFYKSFKVKKIPDNITNKWKEGEIGFKLPEITGDMDYIKLYIWNVDKQKYYLDDIRVDFYTYDIP